MEDDKPDKNADRKKNKSLLHGRKKVPTNSQTAAEERQKQRSGGKSNRKSGKSERQHQKSGVSRQHTTASSHQTVSHSNTSRDDADSERRETHASPVRRVRDKRKPSTVQLEQIPSTSLGAVRNVSLDDVDDAFVAFEIDCAPYNGAVSDEEEATCAAGGRPLSRSYRDGSREHGGQTSRCRRTVSPYPYKLKMNPRRIGPDDWEIAKAAHDSWEDIRVLGEMDDRGGGNSSPHSRANLRSSDKALACQDVTRKSRVGWRDQEVESLGRDEPYLTYEVVNEKPAPQDLRPCLKSVSISEDNRRTMNVSWDDNNEFDTTVDYDEQEDDAEDNAEDEGPHSSTDSPTYPLHKVPSMESVEIRQLTLQTPANSIDEYKYFDAEYGFDSIEGHQVELKGDSEPWKTFSRQNPINDDTGTQKAKEIHPNCTGGSGIVSEWTDEQIACLTQDEKRQLIEAHENLPVQHYDDPNLSRADRVRLLWEDCARKERLLHKLRPNVDPHQKLRSFGRYLY
ncbi:uncharacterized protein [Diadema setosum]|uniref:uncharacterized protein n=1 Tax=Diadema setosum TaxID=31175 RepID=UPI003B3A40FF